MEFYEFFHDLFSLFLYNVDHLFPPLSDLVWDELNMILYQGDEWVFLGILYLFACLLYSTLSSFFSVRDTPHSL
jgi:hypothetical protein